MRKILVALLAVVVTVTGLAASSPTDGAEAAASARWPSVDVLFVGNSLLGTRARTGEDTPDVVRRMAWATERNVRVSKVIRFGSTLQRTWDRGARRALSGAARYDYIVLQEYSTMVATQPAKVEATLLGTYVPALRRSLKPGGRVVLFKNWALVKPAPFASRAENLAAIDAGYARLAAAMPLPTVVAPISDEFETVAARDGLRTLIVPDGKHPTGQAVYLDAATLYGIFFRRSPRELPSLHVAPAPAARLREVAARHLGY